MSDDSNSQSPLIDEFTRLGKSLKAFFNAAWESEERKRTTTEIERGINDLASALNNLASELSESGTGKKIHSEFQDLRDRIHQGDLDKKIQEDMLSALQKINSELERLSSEFHGWQGKSTQDKSQDTL